jgi:hypothetical protein
VKLSVEEFRKQLIKALGEHLANGEIEIVELNALRCKVRVHIAVSVFIDIFYAARTQKASFAVVRKGKRAFGIDNLDGWHSHPLGKPEDHVGIAEPSIEGMVIECTKVIGVLNEEGKIEH